MDPHEIIKLLKRQPFEPFTMRLLDGRTFDVKHPELCIVGRRDVFLFMSHNGGELPIDDWVVLSPVAIASLHPLNAA